jgi:amino acid transporter
MASCTALHCGLSFFSAARMTYAFSRDGAMPFSSVWHKVNEQEVPVNAVWLSAFVSLCMALPVTQQLNPFLSAF